MLEAFIAGDRGFKKERLK
ncbi:hypothetical protein [Paraburkholderia xenovorans]